MENLYYVEEKQVIFNNVIRGDKEVRVYSASFLHSKIILEFELNLDNRDDTEAEIQVWLDNNEDHTEYNMIEL